MDDDYVADVLAKEARDNSRKYATEGLSAYAPRRPAGNAPKPNTRFLRHLIKETDSHNTALKRKEEREARDRMRQLKDQSTRASDLASRSSQRTDRDLSHRESERRRRDDHDDRHRSHRRRHRSRSTSTDRDRSRKQTRRDEGDGRSKHDNADRTERRRERRHEPSGKDRRERRPSYSRSRSRSPRESRSSRHHRSERRRSRSPSGTRSSHTRRIHHRSRRDGENDSSSRQDRLSPVESSSRQKRKASPAEVYRKEELSDESDPLEDLVGPLPAKDGAEVPIRSRGRGAYRPNMNNIDSHFAPDYDPTLDVQPDDDETPSQQSRRPVAGLMAEEDDWDMALEALRDRANWRKKGEDRLRAAGINESAIDKWKNEPAFSGLDGERKPEDVRWSKKGEGREWDRGKYVDDEGHIGVRAAW